LLFLFSKYRSPGLSDDRAPALPVCASQQPLLTAWKAKGEFENTIVDFVGFVVAIMIFDSLTEFELALMDFQFLDLGIESRGRDS
jgi:hypothetical protein